MAKGILSETESLLLYLWDAITSLMSYMPGWVRSAMKAAASTAPDRENLAGQSGVLNLDDLVAAAEQHAVLTNDGAAADRGDTNLVCRTLFAALVTVVNVLRVIGECARNCVS